MSKPLDPAHEVDPLEFLEAYLDGDLDDDARQRFAAHLATSAELRQELHLAERIRGGLQALPVLDCPPQVTQAVLTHAAAERMADDSVGYKSWRSRLAALLTGGRSIGWLRPTLAGAALLALAFVLLPQTPPSPTAADAELAKAEQEVKLALAYLGQIGQRTSTQVTEEVLGHRLVAPVARTVSNLSRRQPTTGAVDHAL